MTKKNHDLKKATWTEVTISDMSDMLNGCSLYELANLVKDLIDQHGQSCIIDFNWYGYEDLAIQLLKYQTESDEDFDKRVYEWHREQDAKEEQSRLDKQKHQEKIIREKAAKEEVERKLYEELKAKYG